VLTLVGGKPVHGDGDFKDLAPPLPPAMPDWSPVRSFGGYQQHAAIGGERGHVLANASSGLDHDCGIHGHAHGHAWAADLPVADDKAFWGTLGCSCWAF
jgi:hypothetical protein